MIMRKKLKKAENLETELEYVTVIVSFCFWPTQLVRGISSGYIQTQMFY